MEIRSDIQSRETRAPIVGDLVVSTETLARLGISDNVALRPENVGPFLANQWGRMNAITNRVEIKSLAGEIPPFDADNPPVMMTSAISQDEQAALGDYGQELSQHLLGIASEGDALDVLDSEVNQHLRDMREQHPEWFNALPGVDETRGRADPSSVDIPDAFDLQFDMNLTKESEEQKRQWQELIAAAKGSPDLVNTIIGMRQASKLRLKMGKLVEAYKARVDQMSRLSAEFDLSRGTGEVSAAQLSAQNSRVASVNMETSNLMQMIQTCMSDYEKITNFTHSGNEAMTQPLKTMIQNMRS